MPEPLRLGLLMHSVLPRGGVVHVLELADALTALGHRVTVIAPAEAGQALFREVAATLALLPMPMPSGDLVSQVRQRIAAIEAALPVVLERGQFDMLHAHDSLNGNALATLRARDRHVPAWVRTVHHLDDFAHPQLAAWQARAWRAADAIAAVSDTWVDRLRSEAGVSAERMFNGVNLARFGIDDAPGDVAALAAWGWREPSGPLCLAVGGIEARKNSVRLLQAFARLRRADPAWSDAQLLMIGGASLLDHGSTVRAWQETLAALGWAEGPDQPVWRAGPVPDAVMPALMRRATLLAMPSLVEGFGLVALEALACGTPVLVSRRAPFTEHLPGCEQVAWCDPEDEASIAAGLQQAARLPRAQATPAVCGRHAWSRSALLHEAWYRRVLADRPRRALPAAALLSL